jgi:Kef-type K+ transport system membrane component KefB
MLILFLAKSSTKAIAVYPAVRVHKYDGKAGAYYTLMMSTGLTFGTISALFGLTHNIITPVQYSYIVGTVIASAVIPTVIANSFFLPRHLLPHSIKSIQSEQEIQRQVAAEEA